MEHLRDSVPIDARIARLAEDQHGVVSLAQLRQAGLSIGAVNARVRAGRLHRLHRCVFAVGHRRLTRAGHWMGAVLALGDGAVLSHVSAAALWDLRPSSATAIHVTVPSLSGYRHRDGIVVHRSCMLGATAVDRRDAIAVTSVARTLLDLATMLGAGPLERAVERSLALRLFDLQAIDAAIGANPRRPGATTLSRIIEEIHDEPALTRSDLENMMRDLCDAHGIARPAVNAIVAGEEVDFHWPARRLVVETDGHEDHGTRTAFERDRAKDAHLMTLGYRVVRFTYRQVVHDATVVGNTLRALLEPGV